MYNSKPMITKCHWIIHYNNRGALNFNPSGWRVQNGCKPVIHQTDSKITESVWHYTPCLNDFLLRYYGICTRFETFKLCTKLVHSFIEVEMSLKLQFKLWKTINHEWNDRKNHAHTSTHLHTNALDLLTHQLQVFIKSGLPSREKCVCLLVCVAAWLCVYFRQKHFTQVWATA